VTVIDAGIAPENFTGIVKKSKPDCLIIIDAIFMNLDPGEIRRVPVDAIGVMHVSTHGIPLSVMVSYFKQYISEIIILGVQPKSMSGEMTFAVKASIKTIIQFIEQKKYEEIPLLSI